MPAASDDAYAISFELFFDDMLCRISRRLPALMPD